jgi:hypothetical protein
LQGQQGPSTKQLQRNAVARLNEFTDKLRSVSAVTLSAQVLGWRAAALPWCCPANACYARSQHRGLWVLWFWFFGFFYLKNHKKNCTLRLCTACLQNLGEEGTAYVMEGLAFNNTCLALDLSQNGVGKLGIAALCQVRGLRRAAAGRAV